MPPSIFRPLSRQQQFTGNPRAPSWGTVCISLAWGEVVPLDVVLLGAVVPLDVVPLDVVPLGEVMPLDVVPLDVVPLNVVSWRKRCPWRRCP